MPPMSNMIWPGPAMVFIQASYFMISNLNWTGHGAVLHGCTVENEAFIGMGATLLDGAFVEKHAMVAAGVLVLQDTRIPCGEVCQPLPLFLCLLGLNYLQQLLMKRMMFWFRYSV